MRNTFKENKTTDEYPTKISKTKPLKTTHAQVYTITKNIEGTLEMNVFDNESVHYEADIIIIDNDVTPGLISEELRTWGNGIDYYVCFLC